MCHTIYPLNSYPNWVGGVGHRKLDSATELLLVFTIRCHGHQGIMGYIVGMSNATVQRISVAGLFFLYNEIDLKPTLGYSLKTIHLRATFKYPDYQSFRDLPKRFKYFPRPIFKNPNSESIDELGIKRELT